MLKQIPEESFFFFQFYIGIKMIKKSFVQERKSHLQFDFFYQDNHVKKSIIKVIV